MFVTDNKRIAKNTMMLYFRMLLLMLCSFYTSRVVLNALGVVDYGIYNVVGGIVGFLAFINSSMSLATNRFLAFALGREDNDLLRRTFSMSVQIHFIIAVIVVILAETVGLWYFYTYLNVPADRYDEAMTVFQISVLTCFINIIIVPFTSLVISHEHMSVYAYISILEGLLKLTIAFLLMSFSGERLVLYAWLMFLASVFISLTWVLTSFRKYPHCRYHYLWDKKIFKDLYGFIGWQFMGSFSFLLRNQGVTLVLNMFFGPALNAVRAISLQVNAAITGFVGNFQMAVNPQLIKTYANNELDEMHNLVFKSSKFSFLLLYVLALPIFIETGPLLELWLKDVPEYTVLFVRLMIIATLCDVLSGTLSRAALATSRIRNYQLVVTTILISDVFIVYLMFKLGYPAEYLFYVETALYLVAFVARLIMLRKMIKLSIRNFLKSVFVREMLVVMVSAILSWCIFTNIGTSFIDICIVIASSFILAAASSLIIGLDGSERAWIYKTIKAKF